MPGKRGMSLRLGRICPILLLLEDKRQLNVKFLGFCNVLIPGLTGKCWSKSLLKRLWPWWAPACEAAFHRVTSIC